MTMLSEDNQAILLLTGRFGESTSGDPTPLTGLEYGRLARWLHEQERTPRDLMMEFAASIDGWEDPKGKITIDRLTFLFGRGLSMSLALEKWSSAGIWVLARGDEAYPKRLRERLGDQCPPVLFGVGDAALLGLGGVSVVGSRKIEQEDFDFAERLGALAASSGMNVVSGGAKGVDETAMLAALQAEGTAVGILADGLMKRALSGKWQPAVKSGDLCLVSAAHPGAGFNVGNAMGRNKYIYCLSDYGVVVRSDKKGGTWDGANEALKKDLAPVFVRSDSDAAGNKALIEVGGRPLAFPAGGATVDGQWLANALGSEPPEPEPDYEQGELFGGSDA